MARRMRSDELWSKLQEILLQHRIYDKPNLGMMVKAIVYRMRVGCPCIQHNVSDIIDLSPILYHGRDMYFMSILHANIRLVNLFPPTYRA